MQKTDLSNYKSVVQEINETENGFIIVLKSTIFYPQGGGQPCDIGTITLNDKVFNVENVSLINGIVHHIGNFSNSKFNIGDEVELSIDKNRRFLNSRLHSAGHLIDEAVSLLGYDWKAIKGNHFPGQASVTYSGILDENNKEKLIVELNDKLSMMIDEGFEVKTNFVSKSELQTLCKNVPYSIPEDKPTRICIIYGKNAVPCGGTHVKNIKDIVKILINKIKYKKGDIKVSYEIQ